MNRLNIRRSAKAVFWIDADSEFERTHSHFDLAARCRFVRSHSSPDRMHHPRVGIAGFGQAIFKPASGCADTLLVMLVNSNDCRNSFAREKGSEASRPIVSGALGCDSRVRCRFVSRRARDLHSRRRTVEQHSSCTFRIIILRRMSGYPTKVGLLPWLGGSIPRPIFR